MAFKSTARAAGHRLQSLWRSLRQQVPLSIHIHIYRRGSTGYNGASMTTVSTRVDNDHLRGSHNQTHPLVAVNPDPEPDFVDEPSQPEPEPNPMSLSTVRLAHLLMNTDHFTTHHEEQLCLVLQAGYAAQDAPPTLYTPSDELFFDI